MGFAFGSPASLTEACSLQSCAARGARERTSRIARMKPLPSETNLIGPVDLSKNRIPRESLGCGASLASHPSQEFRMASQLQQGFHEIVDATGDLPVASGVDQ